MSEEHAVQIGTVWYVWGEHYEVVDDGKGDTVRYPKGSARYPKGATVQERVVRLVPKDPRKAKVFKYEFWVADWRVEKYGEPSTAFEVVA